MDKTAKLMIASVRERADEAYEDYRFFEKRGDKELKDAFFTEWSVLEDVLQDLEKIAGLD